MEFGFFRRISLQAEFLVWIPTEFLIYFRHIRNAFDCRIKVRILIGVHWIFGEWFSSSALCEYNDYLMMRAWLFDMESLITVNINDTFNINDITNLQKRVEIHHRNHVLNSFVCFVFDPFHADAINWGTKLQPKSNLFKVLNFVLCWMRTNVSIDLMNHEIYFFHSKQFIFELLRLMFISSAHHAKVNANAK